MYESPVQPLPLWVLCCFNARSLTRWVPPVSGDNCRWGAAESLCGLIPRVEWPILQCLLSDDLVLRLYSRIPTFPFMTVHLRFDELVVDVQSILHQSLSCGSQRLGQFYLDAVIGSNNKQFGGRAGQSRMPNARRDLRSFLRGIFKLNLSSGPAVLQVERCPDLSLWNSENMAYPVCSSFSFWSMRKCHVCSPDCCRYEIKNGVGLDRKKETFCDCVMWIWRKLKMTSCWNMAMGPFWDLDEAWDHHRYREQRINLASYTNFLSFKKYAVPCYLTFSKQNSHKHHIWKDI